MMIGMLMIMMLFKFMIELLHSIHECVAFFSSFFHKHFAGTNALQGVQKTPPVSGDFASVKTQRWFRSGESAFCQTMKTCFTEMEHFRRSRL